MIPQIGPASRSIEKFDWRVIFFLLVIPIFLLMFNILSVMNDPEIVGILCTIVTVGVILHNIIWMVECKLKFYLERTSKDK